MIDLCLLCISESELMNLNKFLSHDDLMISEISTVVNDLWKICVDFDF